MTAFMQETVAASDITKCGERSIRKPCKGCGRTSDLWWGHYERGNGQDHNYCQKHSVMTTFCLIEADGSKHVCAGQSVSPEIGETPEVTPVRVLNGGSLAASEATPAARPVSPVSTPDTSQVADLLAQLFANSVSPERVNALFDQRWTDQSSQFKSDVIETVGTTIRERLDDMAMPVTVKVEREGRETRTVKSAHKALPLVLATAGASEHVMMVGPMGTGKSTIAAHVAQALDLRFGFMAVGPQTSDSKILGYMSANGEYVSTLFREIYEGGGIFLFDELDAGHGGVLTILNSALANGHMAFPDGMVDRHPDCLIFAAANTYGRGPDRMYVGRQAIDAATLDRFAVIEIDVDEALESQLCYSTGLAESKCDQVLRYVRALRRNAISNKMAVGFSPRASKGMCAMLNAGISLDDAIEARVRRGLSDQDWSKVTAGAVKPAGVSL